MPHDLDDSRIGPLELLPVFFRLHDRTVIVAGDRDCLIWKTDVLLAAGARVILATTALATDDLRATVQRTSGQLTVRSRAWCAQDLGGGVALAIGAFAFETDALAFSDAARGQGIPVCLVDRPQLSDVCFGSIVARGPLTVAISTGGSAPIVAQAVRRRIEALLPLRIGDWLLAAKALRAAPAFAARAHVVRRRFWESFAERLFDCGERAPNAADLAIDLGERVPASASLTVMDDAGGSPDDLTLRAVRALQCADVILYDRAVPPAILRLARRDVMRMPADAAAGESAGPDIGPCEPLTVARAIRAAVAAGKRVVRVWSSATPMAQRRAELAGVGRQDVRTIGLPSAARTIRLGQNAAAARNGAFGGSQPVQRARQGVARKRAAGK
ncbi:MAG: hypothetical protein IPK66_16405 [Rhodospirillales bacterium]|nr:hypothetical protein [Rhodospirillales bacterium]